MKTFISILLSLSFFSVNANSVTLRAVMENVPDTKFIQELLPEFTEKTGIEVEFEVMGYGEMHPKLVPSLTASKGSYDFMPVDFYWVGEFDKAGWMMSLDDMIAKDSFDTSVYFDSLMDLTGRVGDTTYMLPFYNYAMGLTVRKDLINDSTNQSNFKARYGIDLKIPTEWNEYLNQVEFFTDKDKGFYGVVNQGGKADPIAMEWSNYLFARGGSFHDQNWNGLLNSKEALEALNDYISMISNYGPLGAESFSFDEAFNVAAQGNAYSYLTYNWFLGSYNDPDQSSVVNKMALIPVPGEGGLNGSWGWSIPTSSPNPEAAWEFLKWVESPDIAKRRAEMGGAATRKDVFDDPDLNAKFDHYPGLKKLLATSKNFPVFTYTPQFVEVMGTELSKAVIGEQDASTALANMNEQLEELAAKDGKR